MFVVDSIVEDNEVDIISGELSSNVFLSEFSLTTHCGAFDVELFVFCFEVTFCGVTVNSTFRKRVSNISFVFSMH